MRHVSSYSIWSLLSATPAETSAIMAHADNATEVFGRLVEDLVTGNLVAYPRPCARWHLIADAPELFKRPCLVACQICLTVGLTDQEGRTTATARDPRSKLLSVLQTDRLLVRFLHWSLL